MSNRRSLTGLIAVYALLIFAPALKAQEVERTLGWSCSAVQTPSRSDQIQAPVVTGVSLQPGGNYIAVVGDDHIVSIYDRAREEFVSHLIRHRDWVRSARFSPDGKTLATAGNDGNIFLWNMDRPGSARTLAIHPEAVIKLAFSNDGTKLAAVGFENKLRVYDVASGGLLMTLACPCNDMHAVAFSNDDSMIAAGGRSGKIQVWNADGQPLTTYTAHRKRIRSVQFTNDDRIVSVGDECIVKITDLQNENATRELPRHGGKLFDVKVIQGEQLATCGSDNRIYLWDLEAMEKLGSLRGHQGTVACLDSYNSTLVSGSFDTQIRIWDAERSASIKALPTFPRANGNSSWNEQIK